MFVTRFNALVQQSIAKRDNVLEESLNGRLPQRSTKEGTSNSFEEHKYGPRKTKELLFLAFSYL